MNRMFVEFARATRADALRTMRAGIDHVSASVRRRVPRPYCPEKHYMRGPGPACARRMQEPDL